jgi:hypothetical protein
MNDKSDDQLPEELLPESIIDGGNAPLWDSRVQSLMSVAAPMLAEYRNEPVPWWAVLAERWRPRLAVAVAAAAVLTIAVHFALPAPSTRSDSSLPLATLAGGGDDAATLWSITNSEVDPVLALVILEGETP